jgi:hypothetical protein
MNIFGTTTNPTALMAAVATSTSNNFSELSPVFIFGVGLILAMAVAVFLVGMIRGNGHTMDFDDNMPV